MAFTLGTVGDWEDPSKVTWTTNLVTVKAADPWRLSLTRPKAASARSQCFRGVVVLCAVANTNLN